MSKFAVPKTVVPGATPRMEGEGLLQKQAEDSKGRPLWDMPEPVSFHETTQVVTKTVERNGKPKQIKVKEKVAFPVYRGMAARDARYMRSQYRRMQREERARENAENDSRAFITSVLNPTGERYVERDEPDRG